jgi:hypothetical protein
MLRGVFARPIERLVSCSIGSSNRFLLWMLVC